MIRAVRLILFGVVLLGACRASMHPDQAYDHDAEVLWEEALVEVVTPDGYVDYDALENRREALEAYVGWLGDETSWPGRLTKDWHARYLNAYNALVLYQVLERGRPESVQSPRRLLPFAGAAFFVETQFKVGFDWLSLSEIEHERIRQRELDLRDHAAISWAASSSPPLRNELYRLRPKDLKAQLDDQMARWLNDDRGMRFEADRVLFNPIFDWYGRDYHFLSAGQDLCAIAMPYMNGRRKRKLRKFADAGCPHEFFAFDWALNDASAPPPTGVDVEGSAP